MLKSVFSGLIDLLAAPLCCACDKPVESRENAFCLACEACVEPALGPAEADVRALYAYGGPVADAVWRLKYEGRSEVARAFTVPLAERAAAFATRIDGVTGVPLAPAKLRARGYNQSALLAQQVAGALGLAFRPRWLVRTQSGTRQVGKNREIRLQQLQGAFVSRSTLTAKTVLIVDDVRTTGATLREAARALEAAGATRVLKLALAQADRVR